MDFLWMILLELLLVVAAGITFVGGVWGAVIAAGLVSGINLMTHEISDFWKLEGLLVLVITIGIIVLIGLNYKARKVGLVTGLVGGAITLVSFGTFLTPVVALVFWAIIVGTGLIPRKSRAKVIWGFAPAIWRAILGLGWIILGNTYFS